MTPHCIDLAGYVYIFAFNKKIAKAAARDLLDDATRLRDLAASTVRSSDFVQTYANVRALCQVTDTPASIASNISTLRDVFPTTLNLNSLVFWEAEAIRREKPILVNDRPIDTDHEWLCWAGLKFVVDYEPYVAEVLRRLAKKVLADAAAADVATA